MENLNNNNYITHDSGESFCNCEFPVPMLDGYCARCLRFVEVEEKTCPECNGAGWVVVWGHVCNGDERKCQRMCPVEEQAPCPVCANPDCPR